MSRVRNYLRKKVVLPDGTIRKNVTMYAVEFRYKDPGTGESKKTTKRGFTRKKDAQVYLAKIELEKSSGKFRPFRSTSVKDFLATWLEIKKSALAYNTFRGYSVNVNNHIIPYIGDIKLSELKVDDVDNLYLSLGEEDKGLSPASIRYVHRVLSGALDYAIRKNLISSNVAKLADRPTVKRFQSYVYSIDELSKLLELTEDTEMEVIIALAGFMGLRRGEVLGLHWCDVHFEEKYIQVNFQAIPVKGGVKITKPKSEKSIRKVPMTDNVLEILRRYRVKKVKVKLSQGSEYSEKDLVVSKMNGELLSPSTVFNMFKRLLKDNNMPDTRFHDLRHAYCSMLINEVEDIELKTISEIMGHSNIAVTAEVYAHLMYKKKEQAIEGLNEAVSNSARKVQKAGE